MTTYKQKLENLFNDCVAAARKSFMEDGELITKWVVEDKNDARILVVFTSDIPKESMIEKMREMAADHDIVRYAVETEAWMAVGGGAPPSQRPDRMEAIVVMAADRQDNNLLASVEIERKGDKHYLGETIRSKGAVAGGAFQLFEKGKHQ